MFSTDITRYSDNVTIWNVEKLLGLNGCSANVSRRRLLASRMIRTADASTTAEVRTSEPRRFILLFQRIPCPLQLAPATQAHTAMSHVTSYFV
jgi:hypothetical protein